MAEDGRQNIIWWRSPIQLCSLFSLSSCLALSLGIGLRIGHLSDIFSHQRVRVKGNYHPQPTFPPGIRFPKDFSLFPFLPWVSAVLTVRGEILYSLNALKFLVIAPPSILRLSPCGLWLLFMGAISVQQTFLFSSSKARRVIAFPKCSRASKKFSFCEAARTLLSLWGMI